MRKIRDCFSEQVASLGPGTPFFIGSVLLLSLLALPGCSSERSSNLDAKLSHDGTKVALIRYRSSGAEMRIAQLDHEPVQWTRIDIPELTQSFNFGNNNDEVLITYGKNHKDQPLTMHLAGVPLNGTSRLIKEYGNSNVYLAFPEQLDDGSILFLSGLYRTESGRVPAKIWQIIKPGSTPQTISKPWVSMGSRPLVVGTGFYSVEAVYPPGPPGPKLYLWALPGGAAPEVSRYLTSYTSGLYCVSQNDFCLREVTYSNGNSYRDELIALANGRECPILGLPQWIDRINVAASARIAAVVVAEDSSSPREVRILRFASDSCRLINNTKLEN
jgi:hypothetical protein